MSETSKNKGSKITLSGLTKSSNNNRVSTSFRFSPESESIEAIIDPAYSTRGGGDSPNSSPSSTPTSPKPNSADLSPLKEYWMKEKHKWSNKWDNKKSLSLDLDIKGKIKTAFEDKTKSILSNFIPEENNLGIIHTSQSIPENLARQIYSTNLSRSQDTLNGSPEDAIEEVGIDMTDRKHVHEIHHNDDLGENVTFFAEPEDVQEYFDGQPTLYQPMVLLSGVRIAPFELNDEDTASLKDPTSAEESKEQAEPIRPKDIKPSSLITNIVIDIAYHRLMKYWIALAAANLLLPFGVLGPLMWFILGCLTVMVINGGLSVDRNEDGKGNEDIMIDRNKVAQMYKALKLPQRSQGWMTQLLDQPYNPDTCHFRQHKVVYCQLDGQLLYLSYPNARHRIPKRRLWSDRILTEPILFDAIKIYDIQGADVLILPEGLARNRVWNKKYPIVIRFRSNTHFTLIKNKNVETQEDVSKKETTVNYNAGTAEASVATDRMNSAGSSGKEVLRRQDCGTESLYLFARCDREKDDWYRRLVSAAMSHNDNKDSYDLTVNRQLDIALEYRNCMKKICPSMVPESMLLTTDAGLESNEHHKKSSQESSKKSTPDKELLASQNTISSDIENVLTVPQSPVFLNAFLGGLFFDFLRSPYWTEEVKKLIDKKLFYMKKPVVIEGIKVKQLTLGDCMPRILRASPPVLDHQGLWIDLDLNYEGNFNMSLETRINFLKLVPRRFPLQEEVPGPLSPDESRPTDTTTDDTLLGSPTSPRRPTNMNKSHIFDPEADDSGESSEDENESELSNLLAYNPNVPDAEQSKSAKFLEKLANSSLMNRGLVKKLVTNVAATPIILAVELTACNGTLTVNLPSPPNDRIWIGFRTNPELRLVAKPLKFGDTHINISQITAWIKSKLLIEFQRAIVCPNMVDVTIPLMEFAIPR